VDNFARVLNNYCSNITISNKFIIQIPILADEGDFLKVWENYLRIKRLTKHSTKIAIILDFMPDLPSEKLLDRFFGEPVFSILYDQSCFMLN
jgi:hypothetical protein